MTEFVFWKLAYDNAWASKEDVKSAITYGLITQEQGNLILGIQETEG